MKFLRVAERMNLPVDFMTMATVAYGARGSGKTTFGAVVAEEVHNLGQRFCAIDLKGDFWGLRSSADGRGEGIPVVIFGGDHADVPLEPDAGKFLGELVAGMEQSVVLDFEHMSKGKQIRFLGEFFAALYHANREPLLVICDEAQRYAPQRTSSPDQNVCLGAVEDLVKLGRKHGLGVLLLTQRGAGLNKEVSEICDALVAFRTPSSIDQNRVADWLGANGYSDAVISTLAGLDKGCAVFASAHPELQVFKTVQMRPRWTFDSSATPKVGHKRREPKKLAAPELAAIKAKLADAIERAKQSDPKALKARIAELELQWKQNHGGAAYWKDYAEAKERELKEVQAKLRDQKPPKTVERLVLKDALVGRAEKLVDRVSEQGIKLQLLATEIASSLNAAVETNRAVVQHKPIEHTIAKMPMARPKAVAAKKAAAPVEGEPALKKGAVRMLELLVAYHAIGLSRQALGLQTGLPSHGTTFTSYLSNLRAAGYLDESDGKKLRASSSGAVFVENRRHSPEPPPRPSPTKLLEEWGRRLKKGARKMLEHLDASRPAYVPREDLGAAVDLPHTGTTFTSYLSNLRSCELIDESGQDVRISPSFYLGGI